MTPTGALHFSPELSGGEHIPAAICNLCAIKTFKTSPSFKLAHGGNVCWRSEGGRLQEDRPRLLAGLYVIMAPGCWTGGGCPLKAPCVFPGGGGGGSGTFSPRAQQTIPVTLQPISLSIAAEKNPGYKAP